MFRIPLVALFLLTATLYTEAQVTFKKGSLIDKSLSVQPDLIKSEDAFYIIEYVGRNVTQIDLDKDMNEVATHKSILPEGKKIVNSFVYDHKFFCFLKNDKGDVDSYELYQYDPKSTVFSAPIVTVNVPPFVNGSSNMKLEMDLEENVSGFYLLNIDPRSGEALVKIFMLSSDLKNLEWEYTVEGQEPDLSFSKKKIEPLLPVIHSRNAFQFNYFQEGKKEIKITRNNCEVRDGNVQVLSTKSRIDPENDIVQSWSRIPNSGSEEQFYAATFDENTGTFKMTLDDMDRNQLEDLTIKSTIPQAGNYITQEQYKPTISIATFENDSDEFDYTVNIVLRVMFKKKIKTDEFGKALERNYFIQLKVKDNIVVEETMTNMGPTVYGATILENLVVLNKRLDYAKDGKYFEVDEKEVFDVYLKVGATISGFTYYYNIEGTIYALHSEYAMGNMNSQLVEWQFPEE